MDPALKIFLEAMEKSLKESINDAKSASIERHEELVHKLEAHAARTEELAVAASSDATEFVLASAGLAEPPAPAPSIVASPLVAPAAPIDTIAVVPASCSAKCAAQAVTTSTTTTLLPWVPVSSSSPSSASPATSATNDLFSTELATNDVSEVVHDAHSGIDISPIRSIHLAMEEALLSDQVQWPPWPPPGYIGNIHKGYMFRSRPLSSFVCNQEGMPPATHMVQSWLGPSTSQKPCAHSPRSNHMVSNSLLAHSPGDCKLLSPRYQDFGDKYSLLWVLELETQVSVACMVSLSSPVGLVYYPESRLCQFMQYLVQQLVGVDFFGQENSIITVRGNTSFWESSVKSTSECYIAIEFVAGILPSMDWHLLDFPCRSAVPACFSGSRELDRYLCTSPLQKLVVLNTKRRSVSSDEFSCAIQDTCYWPGHFVTGSQMTLVFTAANRGSHCLFSCGCGPVLSSPFVVLCDKWVLPLWDPGQQVVLSDFTKVSCPQAIHDIFLRKLMMQSLHFEHTLITPHKPRPDMLCFAWGDLTCLQNSETAMYALLAASSEMMFMVAFGGGQGTSQGGRHMPATDRNKEFRWPWDPGVEIGLPLHLRQWLHRRLSDLAFLIRIIASWNLGAHNSASPPFTWCQLASARLFKMGSMSWLVPLITSTMMATAATSTPFLDKIDINHVYDLEPFRGGRNTIAVTTFFVQVSASHRYYIDSDQVCGSDNHFVGASFDWVCVSHDYYSYIMEAYPSFDYCLDPDQIKDRRLQWDPGGLSVASAWGQAEFQGGRDVRNLSYTYSYTGWSPGLPHGPGPGCERHRYKYLGGGIDQGIQKLDQARQRRLLPSHLAPISPSPFLLVSFVSKSSTKSL